MLRFSKIGRYLSDTIKSPSFMTLGVFASANMLTSVIGGVGGVIQARWISPDVLGAFQKYSILGGYLAVLSVFVQDGLARQYPYLIGKGDVDEANKVAGAAKAWYLALLIVTSSVFLVLTVMALVEGNWVAVVGWGGQIVMCVERTYGFYYKTMYRRSMEFKRLSYNGLTAAVVNFILLIVVKWWGFNGLAIRQCTQSLVGVWMNIKFLPVKISVRLDVKRLASLAKISLPLSVEGYIRTSFTTATFSYLIVHFCGQRDLGLYGVAASFEGFALLFVSSMMQIFDVKITNKYGKEDSVAKIASSLIRPTVLGFIISIFCAVVLCLVIGPFVRFFIPKYVDVIPVVYILSSCIPLGALIIPVRLLRVALLYKSIYFVACVQVVALLVSSMIVPKSIEWLAGCKVFAEFISICAGYLMLFLAIRHEKCIERKVS